MSTLTAQATCAESTSQRRLHRNAVGCRQEPPRDRPRVGHPDPHGSASIVALLCGFALLLGAPTEPSAHELELSWAPSTPGSGELGFRIERRFGDEGEFVEIAVVDAEVTRFVDRGLDPEQRYCYRLRAFDRKGDHPYSDVVCLMTRKGLPEQPTASPDDPADPRTRPGRARVEGGWLQRVDLDEAAAPPPPDTASDATPEAP